MKHDEKQKYRQIPETAEEQMSMIGYDQGFQDGYLQAQYDSMPEDMKKDFDKIEEGVFSMIRLFGKKQDKNYSTCKHSPIDEHCRDMEEIREVMSCDADAKTKCKMISEIVNGKPHYFKEQENE